MELHCPRDCEGFGRTGYQEERVLGTQAVRSLVTLAEGAYEKGKVRVVEGWGT
jgi:hypothetical protein